MAPSIKIGILVWNDAGLVGVLLVSFPCQIIESKRCIERVCVPDIWLFHEWNEMTKSTYSRNGWQFFFIGAWDTAEKVENWLQRYEWKQIKWMEIDLNAEIYSIMWSELIETMRLLWSCLHLWLFQHHAASANANFFNMPKHCSTSFSSISFCLLPQ